MRRAPGFATLNDPENPQLVAAGAAGEEQLTPSHELASGKCCLSSLKGVIPVYSPYMSRGGHSQGEVECFSAFEQW